MMKETILENGIQYSLHGDYYLPDLEIEPESRPFGRWGRMHRDYLKKYRPVLFNQLVLSGNLWTYLADINEQAQQRIEVLIKQVATQKGMIEELKSEDQIEWVRNMTAIHLYAEEIVRKEIINL